MEKSKFIFDAHAHVGISSLTGNDNSDEYLLDRMQHFGVNMSVVLPQAVQNLEEARRVHDRIGNLAGKYPDKILGMTSLSPRVGTKEYRLETYRCVKEMGFRGIKLEPRIHAVSPDSAIARVVFECARELEIPVMIHTGAGSFCSPTFAIPAAMEFPEVTIILAHMGYSALASEAIIAAQICPNIILETSWSTIPDLQNAVNKIGTRRIIFGSDHAANIPVEFAKINQLNINESEKTDILGETAKQIYHI